MLLPTILILLLALLLPPALPSPLPSSSFILLHLELPTSFPAFTLPADLTLNDDMPVRVLFADHPTATPRSPSFADSPSPYQELQVQVPVLYAGEPHYHTIYSLVDDDVAALLGRDGRGIPRKLGTFDSFKSTAISISRRGSPVLRFEAAATAGTKASCGAIESPFDNLLQITTQAPLPPMPFVPNPLNSVFLEIHETTSLKSCVSLDLDQVSARPVRPST